MKTKQVLQLHQNWLFRCAEQTETAAQEWLPATVPGEVHLDLLKNNLIPDPFYGLNEKEVQWVGQKSWQYRSTFKLPAEVLTAEHLDLCFDGLDTVATVTLNGQEILRSTNMFVPQRLAVKELVRAGENELAILFESALLYGRQEEATHPKGYVWNGESSRTFVRKAQYHYGWDWGPELITAGIWREVRLEAYSARLAELELPVEFDKNYTTATIGVKALVAGQISPDLKLSLKLYDSSGKTVAETVTDVLQSGSRATLTVKNPQLWYPRGYGEQPLYKLTATLQTAAGEVVDSQAVWTGLRRVRLVQEPVKDEPGKSFYFEINGTPVFCGGANWIPADSFTTRLTAADYRLQLEQAAAANFNMLRVWGGGIYESDTFYNLCDELGILVWQDFLFACGIYPAYPEFLTSVKAEAEATVRRLRHHPALVIWCGNNEDYDIGQSIQAYDASFNGNFVDSRFPAREIYERLLPEVCARLDPARFYWPGSPYGGSDVDNQIEGDRHTWEIWHRNMDSYHSYVKWEGRFVSEFGMQAAPSQELLEKYLPTAELYPQSRSFEYHNKAADGPRRLAVYLNDTVRLKDDSLAEYIYGTQFLQAEALTAAYRGWRRRWQAPGKYAVGGALVWQLNDCYPVTSWAIVDYARQPKPAFYTIRRELADQTIGFARTDDCKAAVWLTNRCTHPVKAVLELTTWTLDGQQVEQHSREVQLEANGATELGEVAVCFSKDYILAGRLLADNKVIARATIWNEPYKYLALPDPQITVTAVGEGQLKVTSTRPAKGVWLESTEPSATPLLFSDNMLDLLPDEPRLLSAPGLTAASVKVSWLK